MSETAALPAASAEPSLPARTAEAFVLRLARGLHSYGYPSHRLERAVEAIARRLALHAQAFSMPTGLFVSFGRDHDQRTYQVRVEPGSVNLDKLSRLDQIARKVAFGEMAPGDGTVEVENILNAPPPYGPALTTLAFAIASGGAARFLGGGLTEILTGTLIGISIGVLSLIAQRFAAVRRIFEPLAAAQAALLAVLFATSGVPLSVYVATVAGLIVLMPGYTLTTALSEIANRHLISGTARLTGALGTFLTMGFGVAIGTRAGSALFGAAPGVAPHPLPGWTDWTAALIAPLAFTVLLKGRPKDFPQIIAGSILAFVGARFGRVAFGPEVGPFLGALCVGLAGNAYARLFGRVSTVVVAPGLLILVPGSIGFRSMSSFMEHEAVPAIEAAFQVAFAAISLVMGLLLANALLPQRSLSDPGAADRPGPS